jgi:ATP-dependent RNA helicase RhlE
MGYRAAEIHSNRSLNQRREALEGFKRGSYKVLVATDIASRGIDVTGIEVVVNYDLPEDAGNYVHRIGRTGRAGHKGHAISIATPDQKSDVKDIEKLIRATLPMAKHPDFPPEQFSEFSEPKTHGYMGRNRSSSRSSSSRPQGRGGYGGKSSGSSSRPSRPHNRYK